MSAYAERTLDEAVNPLDIVEELVVANEWPFQRSGEGELETEIAGRWCDYRVMFVWQEESSALHFCCRIDTRVAPCHRPIVSELITQVNGRLWLGHFDLSGDNETIVLRHTSLLRGIATVSAEIVEDLIDLGISECDRYYPAFQLAMWGGKSVSEAMAESILEPVGEA
jgi:hypothetical protein